jgi:hypothetical protein
MRLPSVKLAPLLNDNVCFSFIKRSRLLDRRAYRHDSTTTFSIYDLLRIKANIDTEPIPVHTVPVAKSCDVQSGPE